MKARAASPDLLVDLNGLEELKVIELGADGTCIANAAASINGSLRIALGCVDAVPIVVQPASSDEETVRAAVHGAGLDPPADVHASSEYRGHLAEVLAVRAARQAAERS